MPDPIDVNEIVVTGKRPGGAANDVMAMWLMMELATRKPPEVIFVEPAQGEVAGHTIIVQWDGPLEPSKPQLVAEQIDNLRDAFVRVGEVIASLDDEAMFQLGPVTISGADLKAAFFGLTLINVTDDVYRPGYGGANYGSTLSIGVRTAAGWGSNGLGGYNFIMLHEMIHNTAEGRSLAQQNFDRHLAGGGDPSNYGGTDPDFVLQEQMTNSLVKQIADQTGINVDSTDPESTGYPYGGYYTGHELDPPSNGD